MIFNIIHFADHSAYSSNLINFLCDAVMIDWFQLLNLQRNLEEKQEERDDLERQVKSLKGELDSLSQAQGESGKNAVEAEKARLALQREVDRLNEDILAMEEELQQHERDATSATTELAAKKLEFERTLAAKDQEVLGWVMITLKCLNWRKIFR